MGHKLTEVQLADLGHAHRVVSDKGQTTIVEGGGSDEAIQARIRQIRRDIARLKTVQSQQAAAK